ncbi:hypothetical protein SAMN04515668_3084 [Hymenobacter arizonensis]|uniref:Uncharacterized protein n=1 Tax=Hymenobacter arizonensis TaxID=1227077 RepID=A0A1I5ZP53_HYMAR|nr:hypothetical protein SAMN04515668_3084 [Hymenobacter arizonensis]
MMLVLFGLNNVMTTLFRLKRTDVALKQKAAWGIGRLFDNKAEWVSITREITGNQNK